MVALSVLVYFWVVGNVTVADMAWPIISNEMGLPARAGILVTYVEDFSFMVSQDPHSCVRGERGDATSFRSGIYSVLVRLYSRVSELCSVWGDFRHIFFYCNAWDSRTMTYGMEGIHFACISFYL